MVRAILRSTVPLLPVLLVTRLSPSTRSVRLPTRPGCEQQRGERGAGEEHVPPVVLAHLPTSPSSFGPARMPRWPLRRYRATGGCSHRPCRGVGAITFLGRRTHDARRPPASPGGPRIVVRSAQYGFQPAPTAIATAAKLASAYKILRIVPLLPRPSPSSAYTGHPLRAAAWPAWHPTRAGVAS